MSKKPAAPSEKKKPEEKPTQTAAAEPKKLSAKPPINPFTAEHGRKLGARGKGAGKR